MRGKRDREQLSQTATPPWGERAEAEFCPEEGVDGTKEQGAGCYIPTTLRGRTGADQEGGCAGSCPGETRLGQSQSDWRTSGRYQCAVRRCERLERATGGRLRHAVNQLRLRAAERAPEP